MIRQHSVDKSQFSVTQQRKPGRPRMLQPWQVAYVRRAAALRRQLSNKNLARRFGVSEGVVSNYACGGHKDWPG